MIRLEEQLNKSNLEHKVEAQSDTQSENTEPVTQNDNEKLTVQCLHCSKSFTKRGMTKHANNKHPTN